jgi:hypothetical protein
MTQKKTSEWLMRFGKNNIGGAGKIVIRVLKMPKRFCENCNRLIKKSEGSWCVLCRAKVLASLTPKKKKIINEVINTPTNTSSK